MVMADIFFRYAALLRGTSTLDLAILRCSYMIWYVLLPDAATRTYEMRCPLVGLTGVWAEYVGAYG